MKLTWICVGLATAFFALACGSDPEADLEEASRAVDDARAQVAKDRESVQARESEVQEAQERLVEARSALREAESELARRETAVDRSATDDVLFRTVQKELLEDDDLSKVAISARVSKGVITLSGSVPNEKLRDRALEVARAAPGATKVESRIAVQVSEGKEAER